MVVIPNFNTPKLNHWMLVGLIMVVPFIGSAQPKKALKLFAKGEKKLEKGLYVAASVHFSDALGLYPEYGEAHELRGRSFQGMGRVRAATSDYQKAIDLGGASIAAYVELIRIYREDETYEKALSITEQILEDHPNNKAGAYFDQGSIFEQMGKNQQAKAAFELCLSHCDPARTEFIQEVKRKINMLR